MSPKSYSEKGNHPCLSEDWLLDNLPEGWLYDCQVMSGEDGFIIYPPTMPSIPWFKPEPLFIPLALLKRDRNESPDEKRFTVHLDI